MKHAFVIAAAFAACGLAIGASALSSPTSATAPAGTTAPATASAPVDVVITTAIVRISPGAMETLVIPRGQGAPPQISPATLLLLMADREAVQTLAFARDRVRAGHTLEADIELKEPVPAGAATRPASDRPTPVRPGTPTPARKLKWKVKPTVTPQGIALDYTLAPPAARPTATSPTSAPAPGVGAKTVLIVRPGEAAIVSSLLDADGGTFTVVRAEIVPAGR